MSYDSLEHLANPPPQHLNNLAQHPFLPSPLVSPTSSSTSIHPTRADKENQNLSPLHPHKNRKRSFSLQNSFNKKFNILGQDDGPLNRKPLIDHLPLESISITTMDNPTTELVVTRYQFIHIKKDAHRHQLALLK